MVQVSGSTWMEPRVGVRAAPDPADVELTILVLRAPLTWVRRWIADLTRYTTKIEEPVVLRDSSSRCARAASSSL